MSFPRVFSTSGLACMLSGLVFVSMTTITGASRGRQDGAYGDPCGPTTDNSLICCHGQRESTLIRRDEQCCNGRPLPAGTICCSDLLAVPRASPRHDRCCLRPGTGRDWPRARDCVTFDSRRQFCRRRTGRVHPKPFLGGGGEMTNALSNVRGHQRLQTLLGGSPSSSSSSSNFASSSSSSSSFPTPSRRKLTSSSRSSFIISSYRRALASVSSSPSSSLVVDSSSSNPLFPSWCHRRERRWRRRGGRGEDGQQQEVVEREGQGQGEELLRCCGRESYRPSRHTCCLTTLHDLPANQTRCCQDRAYLIGDSANPCLRRCGSQDMDTNSQMCCDGEIFPLTSRGQMCCGKNAMNSWTHVCCGQGRVAVLRERGPHGCCDDGTLFLRRYTRCSGARGQSSRGPLRREHIDFTARSLCRRALPSWGRHWPDLNVVGEVLHLEGQVTKVMKNVTHVHLTLQPFRVASPDLARSGLCQAIFAQCTSGNCSAKLRVILDLRDGAGRTPANCHGRKLRRYLTGDTLTTLSPLSALDCNNSRAAFLGVPSRSSDFLLLRKEELTV